MPIVNGLRGAYLQPPRYGRGESGPYTLYTWEGTRDECLQNVAAIENAGGFWEMQESYTGAKCQLTARFATAPGAQVEVPVDNWEFFAGAGEKDLLHADTADIAGISDQDKRDIKEALDNSDAPVVFQNPNSDLVYRLMLEGVRSVRILTPTLRHTQTVSRSWTIPASFTNVGRIISTASMKTLESIPSGILFQLPTNTSNRPELVYGWLKEHPTVRFSAGQKTQIEQQWEYGLWPPISYGPLL